MQAFAYDDNMRSPRVNLVSILEGGIKLSHSCGSIRFFTLSVEKPVAAWYAKGKSSVHLYGDSYACIP